MKDKTKIISSLGNNNYTFTNNYIHNESVSVGVLLPSTPHRINIHNRIQKGGIS